MGENSGKNRGMNDLRNSVFTGPFQVALVEYIALYKGDPAGPRFDVRKEQIAGWSNVKGNDMFSLFSQHSYDVTSYEACSPRYQRSHGQSLPLLVTDELILLQKFRYNRFIYFPDLYIVNFFDVFIK
jgi:hypothetical protein